jgi:hypothetical protein
MWAWRKHHKDCDFWCDQYPWECNCGIRAPILLLIALWFREM